MPSSRILCPCSALLCVLIVFNSHLYPFRLSVLAVCRHHLPPACVSLICWLRCVRLWLDQLSTVSSCTLYLYILRYTIHIPTYQISICCIYGYTHIYIYTVHTDILYIYFVHTVSIHTHLIYTVHIYLIQIYLIYIIRQYIIYTLYTLYIYRYYIHIHHI